MQKIFNTLLLLIFLGLVALYGYKTLKTPEVVKAQVDNIPAENPHPANNISDHEFNNKIHDYIVNHPEVLIESIEKLQRKKMNEANKQANDYLAQNKSVIENDGVPPILGNKDGDIVIVLFYDYNCSFCKQANEFTNELLKNDSGVKLILRPIPILGGSSMYATKIALAVHKISEEKFLTIHNEMMRMKPITEEEVKKLLVANDIDYAMVENEVNSFAVKQLIAKNFDLAKNLGIKGAPSQVINGVFIPGLIDVEKYTAIIEELRQTVNREKPQTTPEINNSSEIEENKGDIPNK